MQIQPYNTSGYSHPSSSCLVLAFGRLSSFGISSVTLALQVGVDVNTAIHHEWLFSPLQFVPGLGPRKAQALQQALIGRGRLTVRKDLLNFNLLSRKVFINSAGSMRTRPTGAAAHAEVRILSVGFLFRRCSRQDCRKACRK
jgi:hypothetical protein